MLVYEAGPIREKRPKDVKEVVNYVSKASTTTARLILEMREQHRELITGKFSNSSNGLRLLDYLFDKPIINVREAGRVMDVSYVTASSVIGNMEKAGLLIEITGQKRNKVFRYEPYITLFNRQTISLPREMDETGRQTKTASPNLSS